MINLSDMLAESEARCGGRPDQRIVLHYVIKGATLAGRWAKAAALAAAHDPRTFHIFSMVIKPAHV